MKSIILSIIVAVAFIAAPSICSGEDIFENTDLGAEVSFPNIVLKKGDHSIGIKLWIKDISENWDEGSQALITYENRWCLGICD